MKNKQNTKIQEIIRKIFPKIYNIGINRERDK